MGYMMGWIGQGNIGEGPRVMGLDPSRGGEESRTRMLDKTRYEIVLARSTPGASGPPADQRGDRGLQVRNSERPGMQRNRGLAFAHSTICPLKPLRGHRIGELSG